jgi:hypothetical protein
VMKYMYPSNQLTCYEDYGALHSYPHIETPEERLKESRST